MEKAKSMIGGADIAKLGYRKLPGSAVPEMGSASYDHTSGREYARKQLGEYHDPGAGNIKEIEGASGPGATLGAKSKSTAMTADNSTAISGSMVQPSKDNPADVALSERHHRESIHFNESHAAEHLAEAKKHRKALAKMNRRGG